MTKTNAMRLLDRAGIKYKAVTYVCGPDDGQIGLDAASQIKEISPRQCFKTLVGRGEKKGILVFCVPVTEELDLKAAASAAGDKKTALVHVKEIRSLTGYIRGGCSPVGMKKNYPTYIDESALSYPLIGISGGMRGLQLILDPHELAKFTEAEFVRISRDGGMS